MRKDFFFFVTRGMARDLCLHHSSVPSGQLYVCVYNIFPEREREKSYHSTALPLVKIYPCVYLGVPKW